MGFYINYNFSINTIKKLILIYKFDVYYYKYFIQYKHIFNFINNLVYADVGLKKYKKFFFSYKFFKNLKVKLPRYGNKIKKRALKYSYDSTKLRQLRKYPLFINFLYKNSLRQKYTLPSSSKTQIKKTLNYLPHLIRSFKYGAHQTNPKIRQQNNNKPLLHKHHHLNTLNINLFSRNTF